jgi:hypothetical protein
VKKETDENPAIPLWVMMAFGAVVVIGLAVAATWYFVHHGTFDVLP